MLTQWFKMPPVYPVLTDLYYQVSNKDKNTNTSDVPFIPLCAHKYNLMYLVCLQYSIYSMCVCTCRVVVCWSVCLCLLAGLVALCATPEQGDKDYQAGSLEEFI